MPDHPSAAGAVFLSYASQDAEAAKRICEALRAAGVEVWFDQSELVGGDQWDQKIRKQIKECALLIPIISAATQARTEGYFRLEWRLADQRTHLMAKGRAFLLPVVIDVTRDADAHVPDSFTEVQWTRLPGGETPVAFCERVNRLLSGTVAGRDRLIPPQGATAGSGDLALQKKHRTWLVLAIVGAVAIGAVLAWFARQHAPSAQPTDAKPVTAATAPLSEARQLLERARVILRADGDLPRDNLEAVEKLLAKAVVLDSTDAECWALAGWIDAKMVTTNYDGTNERRLEAQRKAAKAMALAPGLPLARRAHAYVLAVVLGPSMLDEVIKIYRALIAEAPGDRSLKIEFGTILRNAGRIDEAALLFEQTGNRPSAAWNYFTAGRFSEARRLADQLLAEKRTTSYLLLKGLVEWLGFEDLDAAQAVVDQFTPAELLLDDPMVFATAVAVHRRDPERVIRLINNFPREFLSTNGFFYPKRFWAGQAHQMAGRAEAAEAEWELALRLVDERLKDTPNEPQLLLAKADLLISLGQRQEAGRLFQLSTGLGSFAAMTSGDFYRIMLLARLGRAEEALAAIAAAAAEKRQDSSWPILHANLRFQPFFDGLRKDPRFEKLLRDNLPPGAKPFDDPKPAAPATKPDEKSVAVLAFANLSDDKANEYFSDGISEELLNVLAKIPGLKVTARTSSFHFKGMNTAIPEIAAQLGVAYVIEGSVRKQGDKVRITAQLIKAADGFHVWSDTFTRDLKDIFAVQDEIAGLIAQQLQLKLGESSRAMKQVNPEAYEHLLQARFFSRREDNDGWRRGIEECRAALAIDPDYALAAAEMARSYISLCRFGGIPLKEGFQAARPAAERAMALNPDLPEANSAMGWVQRTADWDLLRAGVSFRRAYELAPRSAEMIRDYAVIRCNQGYIEEAIELLRRSLKLDPLNASTHCYLALFLAKDRSHLDESVVEMKRGLELAPDAVEWHAMLTRILVYQGKFQEAAAAAELESSERYRLFARALILAPQKDHLATERAIAELIEKHGDTMSFHIGELYAVSGEVDRAFEWMDRALIRRDTPMVWILTTPTLGLLTHDPRWPVLLKKMGFSAEQLK